MEFADWDGQTAIGKGNCESESILSMDSMTYHTERASETDVKAAIQYRNIENPWGNIKEWRDGIFFDEEGNICTYNNLADFKKYNGAGAVVRNNKLIKGYSYIKAWGYDTDAPSFIYSSAIDESDSTYIPNFYMFGMIGNALVVGGSNDSSTLERPFYLGGNYSDPLDNYGDAGLRLQELPRSM